MVNRLVLPVPEPKILEKAKTSLALAREKPRLAKYGFDASFCTGYEADISKTESYKSDEELIREQKAQTELKNLKLAEAGQWGDGIKLRLKLAVPGAKNEFPDNFLKAKKDETLMLEVLPNIGSLIVKYEAKLKEKGLTDEDIQKGVQIRSELNELNKQQDYLMKRKPEYTAERITSYMNLYNTVNEINKAGRLAYADSEAELLLFNSPWPVKGKQTKATDEVKPV